MLALYSEGRRCKNCGELKPHDLFLGPKDNTCKLCRKLITKKLRIYHNIKLCKEILISDLQCPTCKHTRLLDEFPENARECIYCWTSRNYIEYYQHEHIEAKVICLVCDKERDVSEFPSGELICKTCIYTANSYRRSR
jgi:hypothetical protein